MLGTIDAQWGLERMGRPPETRPKVETGSTLRVGRA